MPTDPGWSRADDFAVKSWQGTAVGACIALVVPMAFFLLALLLKIGVVPSDQMHAPLLTLIMFSEVLLGPIGIVIAGWSAGVRGFVPWLFLIIVAAPLVGAVWIVSVLFFGGATGSPA